MLKEIAFLTGTLYILSQLESKNEKEKEKTKQLLKNAIDYNVTQKISNPLLSGLVTLTVDEIMEKL